MTIDPDCRRLMVSYNSTALKYWDAVGWQTLQRRFISLTVHRRQRHKSWLRKQRFDVTIGSSLPWALCAGG